MKGREVKWSEVKWVVDMISMNSKVKWSEGLIGQVKKMKWSGESFFRAVKGFIILEISLEMEELYCV